MKFPQAVRSRAQHFLPALVAIATGVFLVVLGAFVPSEQTTQGPSEEYVSWPTLEVYPTPVIGLDPNNPDHQLEYLQARMIEEDLAVLERDDRERYIVWVQAAEHAQDIADAQAAAARAFSATSGATGQRIYEGGGYCSTSFLSQWWGGRASAAASVCQCESGGNPNAVGGGGAYHGLFQFLRSTFASVGGGAIYDPADNASAAARLQARSGWGQWPACAARAGLL